MSDDPYNVGGLGLNAEQLLATLGPALAAQAGTRADLAPLASTQATSDQGAVAPKLPPSKLQLTIDTKTMQGGMEQGAQRSFFNQWAPYAMQASKTLGVDPNIILAQWAHESDYGRSHVAQTTGNMAGINIPGGHGQDYAKYNSPQDFTNAYVTTMQNPAYKTSLNTSNPAQFVAGLTATPGHFYFTGDPKAYTSRVTQIASTNPMAYAGDMTDTGHSLSPPDVRERTVTSLNPPQFSGPQLSTTASPNPLALSPPTQPQNLSGMIGMALLSKLVPSTHTLHPIDYDPFKAQVKTPMPEAQAESFKRPERTPIETGVMPRAGVGPQIQDPRNVRGLSLVPGARASVQDLMDRVTGGGTGSLSLRRGVG